MARDKPEHEERGESKHVEDEAVVAAQAKAEKARKVREADAEPPEVGDTVTMQFRVEKVQPVTGLPGETGFDVTLRALEADGVEEAKLPQISCNNKLVTVTKPAAGDKKRDAHSH